MWLAGDQIDGNENPDDIQDDNSNSSYDQLAEDDPIDLAEFIIDDDIPLEAVHFHFVFVVITYDLRQIIFIL